jgi:ABC-type tungstate transport system permease subunit
VLADRGTWLSFRNRGDSTIVVEGDKRLFNQYGVMLVNPAKHPQREEGSRAEVHRLARVARRPGGDRAYKITAASSFPTPGTDA